MTTIQVCTRCKKIKKGVYLYNVLDLEVNLCGKCRTSVSNLLKLYKSTKSEIYQNYLQRMIFNPKG